MVNCSVCHNSIVLVDSARIKHRKTHRRKYMHGYCRWRLHNFWTQDFWSVIVFLILSLICFLFLILGGAIGNSVVLRNVSYIFLAWTIGFSLWLFWLNYFKMYRDCCEYYDSNHKSKKEYLPEDEVVTKEDIVN